MSTHSLAGRSVLRKSDLREANQRLLLNIIRQSPGASRADIVRITGFSPSSVTFIVNRMLRDGLLREAPSENHAQVGRRPLTLQIKPDALLAAGVEIARSEARIALAGLDGAIVGRRAVAWQPDHRVFLARVHDALRSLTSSVPPDRLLGVGVSIAGTIDRNTGRVIAAENLDWFDVEAGSILSAGFPAPFYFENDAKLGALAERWFCEPGSKPLEDFVFLVLRPGLGTGVIIEGRLFHGASGEASEFGHTSLFPEGRRCLCGGCGCWEEYASERALERFYLERHDPSRRPDSVAAEEIVQLAREGYSEALDALHEIANYVGMGFANLNAAFNPEAIVVGDYLAAGWDLMKEWVWEALRRQAPHRFLNHLRIIPSRHGSDSALMGALALVLAHFFTQSGPVNGHGPAHRSHSRRHAR